MVYSDNDVLLIIDIQEMYKKNFNIDYLLKVNLFFNNKFKEVRCMVDIFNSNKNGEYIPKFIYDQLTHPIIFKQYSINWPEYQLDENNISMDDINKKCTKIKDGYLFSLESTYSNRNFYEYITEDYANVLNEWKKNNKTIHIIGGGLNRCVSVTCKILDVMNIKYKIHNNLCYDIDRDKEYDNIFQGCKNKKNKYPTSLYERIQNKYDYKWEFIHNTDKELLKYYKLI